MPNTHGRKPPAPPPFRGRGAPPPGSHKSSGKGACDMQIPIVIAMMPWALMRLWIDTRRERRGQ